MSHAELSLSPNTAMTAKDVVTLEKGCRRHIRSRAMTRTGFARYLTSSRGAR